MNPNQRGGEATPFIVIEGLEEATKRDLAKHTALIARTRAEIASYRAARSQEVRKKRNYRSLIGGGKYNDDALRASIKDINVNIRHMSDRADQAEQKLEHHQLIVDTLTKQLEDHEEQMKKLRKFRLMREAGLVKVRKANGS
jgi:chromosome segregation ATPase